MISLTRLAQGMAVASRGCRGGLYVDRVHHGSVKPEHESCQRLPSAGAYTQQHPSYTTSPNQPSDENSAETFEEDDAPFQRISWDEMRSLRSCAFHTIAHLGRDFEPKDTPKGKVWTSAIPVAGPKEGERETGPAKQWIKLNIWKEDLAAEAMAAFRKGSQVGVAGTLSFQEWTDREGNVKKAISCTVESLAIVKRD